MLLLIEEGGKKILGFEERVRVAGEHFATYRNGQAVKPGQRVLVFRNYGEWQEIRWEIALPNGTTEPMRKDGKDCVPQKVFLPTLPKLVEEFNRDKPKYSPRLVLPKWFQASK